MILSRLGGKKKETAYDEKDVHNGITVASPPCDMEEFWTDASMHKHTPAKVSNTKQ